MEALTGKGRRVVAAVRSSNLLAFDPTARGGRPGGETADGHLSFWRVIRLLRTWKVLILTMVALGGVVAIMAGLLSRPSYTAIAQVIVDQRPLEATNARTPVTMAVEEAAIDTHVTVLTSDALLRRVAAALLAEDAAQAPRIPGRPPGASVSARVSARFGRR
ncbi:Wzz/FepE/Etk N-terminal domain-containing protein [Phreatobacter stygius]|nr:Wzz/FepE/Etk N-terminal domain-containing protein [Phreatobacter stygius]